MLDTQTRVEVSKAFISNEASSKAILASERGQAIIEYILLMVVVLALAYGLAQQLFTPVRQFTQFVLGEYVECLLDQGQLPALGGESQLEDCEFDFDAAFGSTSPARPSEGSASNPNQTDAQRRLAERPRGGGSSEGAGGRGARRFSLGRTGTEGISDTGPIVAEAENRQGQSGDRFMRFRDSRARDRESRRRVVIGQNRFINDPFSMRSVNRGSPIPLRAPTSEESSAVDQKNRRFQVDPDKPLRTPKDLALTADWSFGIWLRYLLILVILIALILFIAGQVNQISKGMEKS